MRARLTAVLLFAAFTSAMSFSPIARSDGPSDAALSAPSAPSDHVPELDAAIRTLLREPSFANADIGISIIDVDTGRTLASEGEHRALNPASNAKIYTACAALALLHGDHRYQTTLSGTTKSGAVSQLALRGHGDPSLSARDLWQMARDLEAHGVKHVDDITLDQRFYDDQTTPPAFEQQPNEWAAFRAPVSAIAVNENTVTLSVRPGAPGGTANAWFDPPGFVDVDGTVHTSDGPGADEVTLALSPNGHRLSAKISGTIGSDAGLVRYTRRVDDPQLLAGYVLRAILEQDGVKVSGDVKLGSSGKNGSIIARHESAPLGELLTMLGKQSDNFYAEMIFKSLGAEIKSRPGKSADAADVVSNFLQTNNLSDTGVVVKNGSGLFDANRVTADSITRVLRYAYRDATIGPEFVSQLAVGGVDGTLAKRFRNLKEHRAIRAKTGTLEDTVALSGYVLGPPGKSPIAFSIVINKIPGKVAAARSASDALVKMIYERQWGR